MQNKRSTAARAGRAARSLSFNNSRNKFTQIASKETRSTKLCRRIRLKIFRISWMTQGPTKVCSRMSCWKMAPSWTLPTRMQQRGTASSLTTVRYPQTGVARRNHRCIVGQHRLVWAVHCTRKIINTFSSFKSGSTKNLWNSSKIGWYRGTSSTWPLIFGTNNSKINKTMAIILRSMTNKFSTTNT